MRKFIIFLMITQVLLFIAGVYVLFTVSITAGLFATIVNPVCFLINKETLKNYN